MQIVIKVKGFLKVAFFFVAALCVLSYACYKLYQYIAYRKTQFDTDQKLKKKLHFHATVLANDHSLRGYLLLSSIAAYHGKNYSNILIMDGEGNVLMQKQMAGIIYDFRQWHNNGQTLYSYAVNEQQDSPATDRLASSGHIVILDSALNEIRQLHLRPHGDIAVDKNQDLDLHDFILLPGNHYIAIASYCKTVNNIPACLFPAPGPRVLSPVIQEVRNDSVVWQWDASACPEFYISSNAGNHFYDSSAQDYIHMNSMTLDPQDSNLVVSFLNQNQVLKIDRRTGQVLWRLGGRNSDFPLTRDQVFLRQHNATFTDSGRTLTLLDNGDDSIRPYSRVLEFQLNQQEKTVSSFRSYRIPARIIGSRGSVQKTGGNYIICGGISNYILVADCQTGAKKLELKANQSFYRAYLADDTRGIKTNR